MPIREHTVFLPRNNLSIMQIFLALCVIANEENTRWMQKTAPRWTKLYMQTQRTTALLKVGLVCHFARCIMNHIHHICGVTQSACLPLIVILILISTSKLQDQASFKCHVYQPLKMENLGYLCFCVSTSSFYALLTMVQSNFRRLVVIILHFCICSEFWNAHTIVYL